MDAAEEDKREAKGSGGIYVSWGDNAEVWTGNGCEMMKEQQEYIC